VLEELKIRQVVYNLAEGIINFTPIKGIHMVQQTKVNSQGLSTIASRKYRKSTKG